MTLPTTIAAAEAENRPWYVLTVPEGRELRAREAVRGLGHAAWLPMEVKRVRDSQPPRRTRAVRMVLLPGYVFAAVAPGADWRQIVSLTGPRLRIVRGEMRDAPDARAEGDQRGCEVGTRSARDEPSEGARDEPSEGASISARHVRLVTGWLPVHDEPRAVPHEQMRRLFDLQRRWDLEGDVGRARRRFEPGSRHEVMSGPFAGFSARVEGVDGAERVRAIVATIAIFGGEVRTFVPVEAFG